MNIVDDINFVIKFNFNKQYSACVVYVAVLSYLRDFLASIAPPLL